MAVKKKGIFYLCGTPLGNLEDLTLRVLRVLKEVDLIAAEDTRRTQKLLSHYEIHNPMTSFYEHNESEKIPFLLHCLEQGKKVALVTDAGMPGVADPGYSLLRSVLAAGYQAIIVPGPTAVTTALVISGLSPYPFYFQGFLPRQKKARRELLEDLKEDSRTGVFYESPHRLLAALEDFLEIWGPDREAVVARELTKQHEEVIRGSFSILKAHFTEQPVLGEITLVTAGIPEKSQKDAIGDNSKIYAAVEVLIAAGARPQEAVKAVAKALGTAKSDVYKIYVSSKKENPC